MNYNFKGFAEDGIAAVEKMGFNEMPDLSPCSLSVAYANGETGKRPTVIVVVHGPTKDHANPLNAGEYSNAVLEAGIPINVAWEEQSDGLFLPNVEKVLLGGIKGKIIMTLAP